MGFIDADRQPVLEPAPGIRLRTPYGDKLMLSLVEFDDGAEVPWHSHPHEQGGVLISGRMRLSIGDETRTIEPGGMYIIPGNTRHRAVAVDGPAVAMDVFYPIREDYVQDRGETLMNSGNDQ